MRISGWMLGIATILFMGLTAVCAILTFGLTRQAVIDFNILSDSPGDMLGYVLGVSDPFATPTSNPLITPTAVVIHVATQPSATPLPGTTFTPEPTGDATTVLPTITPIDASEVDETAVLGPRRMNILLLGIDQRSATDDPGPFRTDTMMLISIDPVQRTVGIISIPRDLWVTIPGFQPNRINTANLLGDNAAYPGGGGPALAAATVTANLGIEVHRYLMVNFEAFDSIVNILAPEGVEICVEQYIFDDHYPDALYGTITVEFQVGCQIMNGERLLQFARTRATQGSDFDRARRQQQVMTAMREHVLQLGNIPNLIAQVPTLFNEMSSNIRTNLTPAEIIALGRLMTQIDSADIHTGVISNLYVTLGTDPTTGAQVLIPNQTRIADLIQQTFYPDSIPTEAELRARAEGENATIVVYNNTDIQGLASDTALWLNSRGIITDGISTIPNAPNRPTYIRDYTGNRWTARYLATVLGISFDRIEPGADGLTTADIMIVVGTDILPLIGGD